MEEQCPDLMACQAQLYICKSSLKMSAVGLSARRPCATLPMELNLDAVVAVGVDRTTRADYERGLGANDRRARMQLTAMLILQLRPVRHFG